MIDNIICTFLFAVCLFVVSRIPYLKQGLVTTLPHCRNVYDTKVFSSFFLFIWIKPHMAKHQLLHKYTCKENPFQSPHSLSSLEIIVLNITVLVFSKYLWFHVLSLHGVIYQQGYISSKYIFLKKLWKFFPLYVSYKNFLIFI